MTALSKLLGLSPDGIVESSNSFHVVRALAAVQ
jgi:hypothetical protein